MKLEEIYLVYCIHCGKQNPDDAETCSSCGKRLQTPAGRGERKRYRARPIQRSSDACWEEADVTKGPTRGGLLVLGLVLICVSLFISWAIYDTVGFEAFWENFGESIANFFEAQNWENIAKLVGPIILIVGVIIIFYGLIRYRD